MTDLDDRPWFVFKTWNPFATDPYESRTFVPATSETAAREAMRLNVAKEIVPYVDRWPLVGTRFCSREALTKSLLRKRGEE